MATERGTATICVEKASDTYLDYDLYMAQQTWDDEDWDAYDRQCDDEAFERELAWEEASEEQKREANYYDGLHQRYCDETLVLNKKLPAEYCVTWYVASVWPRFVLWHDNKPLAGFKNEHKGQIVSFAANFVKEAA